MPEAEPFSLWSTIAEGLVGALLALAVFWCVVRLVPHGLLNTASAVVALAAIATGFWKGWWVFAPVRWLASAKLLALLGGLFGMRWFQWGHPAAAMAWSGRFIVLLVLLVLLFAQEIKLLAPWLPVAWNPWRGLRSVAA